MLKKRLGRLVPYQLIAAGRRIAHFGPHRCPVCEGRYRHLHDSGYGHEVLERLDVVGGKCRPADKCPLCHATARERLVKAWLTRADFAETPRIAHFAPEKGLTKVLQGLSASYRAFDAAPSRYRHLARVERADLMALDLPADSIDLLVCNHVIEHVPDADRAMRELARVLAPGGVAVLQVPIALGLDATVELGTDSTPEERVAQLGQDDHLRLFTQRDYVQRLQRAGFAVEQFSAFANDSERAREWQLDPQEVLFLCRLR
ncbi:MAG: class I SAM-dependent methyltransferase [Alteraurantiacibacter sp.]